MTSPKKSRAYFWSLTGILLLGFALRLYGLTGQPIWGDEAFSIAYIKHSLAHVLTPGLGVHPPFYYAELFLWRNLTGAPDRLADPFMMRYNSLLTGMLLIAFAYALARRLAGRRVALLTAFLVAIAPLHIYYAGEIRAYSLLALLAAASTWAFVRLTQTRQGKDLARQNWLLYGLFTLAGMYTHYSAFWIIAAHNVTALFTGAWTGRRWRWLGGQVVLAILYLPWVIGNMGFVLSRGAESSGYALPLDLIQEVWGQSVRSWVVGQTGSPNMFSLFVIAVTLLGALVGVVVWWRRSVWPTVLLVSSMVLTLVMVLLIDPVMPFAFSERFAIAGALPLIMLTVAGILALFDGRRLLDRGLGIAALLVLLVGSMAANVNWYTDDNPNRDLVANHDWQPGMPVAEKLNYADAIDAITAELAEGDLLLLNNNQQSALSAYYAPEPVVLLDDQQVNSADVDTYLQDVVGDSARVWLVEFGDPVGYDSARAVPDWLAERGFRQRYFSYYGGTVSLYDLAAADVTPESTAIQFGDDIRLTGVHLTPLTARPGDTIYLTLVWEAINQPSAPYTVSNQIVGEAGLLAQIDAEPRGGSAPTDSWQPGDVIQDRYAIELPAGAAPGEYAIRTALYAWPELTRLPVQGGDPQDDAALLGMITIGE